MENILPLLECLEPDIGITSVRQLSIIIQVMLAMTGRVTMLAISRWTGFGGSCRTIQGFFYTALRKGRFTMGVFPKIFMVL